MAFNFEFYGTLNGTEGIEVLNFGTGAKFGCTFLSERDVYVKTHVAVVEVAISDFGESHEAPELFAIVACIGDRVNVWHGNDFDERRIDTVEVDE